MVDVGDKLREHSLRWFDHVMRQVEEDLIRTIHRFRAEGRRDRGTPN